MTDPELMVFTAGTLLPPPCDQHPDLEYPTSSFLYTWYICSALWRAIPPPYTSSLLLPSYIPPLSHQGAMVPVMAQSCTVREELHF